MVISVHFTRIYPAHTVALPIHRGLGFNADSFTLFDNLNPFPVDAHPIRRLRFAQKKKRKKSKRNEPRANEITFYEFFVNFFFFVFPDSVVRVADTREL